LTSITVRIPKEMKKDIETLKIEVSEVTRTALENEVRRLKREKAKQAAANLSKLLATVPDEKIKQAVRESRDER
jgi:post-segregation antitoxin (ccd killing protein)